MSAFHSQRDNQTTASPRRGMPHQLAASLILACFLAACGSSDIEANYPEKGNGATADSGSLFENFSLGMNVNGKADREGLNAGGGLGVNALLWRATLDTLSFMPIGSTDPVGGVIITDWYNDPATPNERMKINVVIQGLELRADALSVSLFRETRVNDRWASIAGSRKTERQLENIILIRARELKMASQSGN